MMNQGLPSISQLFEYLEERKDKSGYLKNLNENVLGDWEDPKRVYGMGKAYSYGTCWSDARNNQEPGFSWNNYNISCVTPTATTTSMSPTLSSCSPSSHTMTRSNSIQNNSLPAFNFSAIEQTHQYLHQNTHEGNYCTFSPEPGLKPPILSPYNSSHQYYTTNKDHKTVKLERSFKDSNQSSPSEVYKPKYCTCEKTSYNNATTAHIPRPRNAFILFRQHWHKKIFSQEREKLSINHHSGIKTQTSPFKANSEASRYIGHRWRSLSKEKRQYWINLAELEKKEHRKKYPGYKYVPVRKSKRTVNALIDPHKQNIEDIPNSILSHRCTSCGGHKPH